MLGCDLVGCGVLPKSSGFCRTGAHPRCRRKVILGERTIPPFHTCTSHFENSVISFHVHSIEGASCFSAVRLKKEVLCFGNFQSFLIGIYLLFIVSDTVDEKRIQLVV